MRSELQVLKKSSLYSAYRFFKKHAGWREGHSSEGALALARAERWIEDQDELDFLWEYEEGCIDDFLGDHEYWCATARRIAAGYTRDGEPAFSYLAQIEQCEHEVLYCALVEWDLTGISPEAREYKLQWDNNLPYDVLASLGGIVDADRDYRRVVEAELALEVLCERQRDAQKEYAGEIA